MATTYKKLILDYCSRHSVAVPAGFGRNTPGRFAVVRTDQTPPKLIATTWLKQEDVAYYFEHFLVPQVGSEIAAGIHVLDFKEGRRLLYRGSTLLAVDSEFARDEKMA